MTRVNIAADVLGVMLGIGIACLLAKLGASPAADIDATELIRTALFIGSIAAAVGFTKHAFVDFAKLLRENGYDS